MTPGHRIIKDWAADKKGRPIAHIELSQGEYSLSVISWGATLQRVTAPDARGESGEILLGLPRFADYEAGHPYLGSTVGRYANRIGGSQITIGNQEWELAPNQGSNQLHGGPQGFDKRIWDVTDIGSSPEGESWVTLSMESPHGDQGFPGNLKAECEYRLSREGVITLGYRAVSDQTTVISMTNHGYWNLSGKQPRGQENSIGNHRLILGTDSYLEVDEGLIPTGEVIKAQGSAYDFSQERVLGDALAETGGIDHCYLLKRSNNCEKQFAARLTEPESGRIMEIFTDCPGLQLYTAQGLNHPFSEGAYHPFSAVCLETQALPDSPHHKNFPTTLLHPGETYRTVTTIHLGCKRCP